MNALAHSLVELLKIIFEESHIKTTIFYVSHSMVPLLQEHV